MAGATNLKTTIAASCAVAALIGFAPSADAARACRPALSGQASSTGILGLGTQLAREAAIADFEQRAEAAYGRRYGNFRNARFVRWDCKKGAILLAKCVVTARPCR